MALWGSPWGFPFPWGGADLGDDWACALSQERVLVQHPDATGERVFRDWICAFSEQAGDYLDVTADVKASLDLDTAVGVQLDMIGSVVGLPRSGFDDTRYRTLLTIQTKLLIGSRPSSPQWTGTCPNIITICRDFIGAGVLQPVVLHNIWPYAYILTIPGISLPEVYVLMRFLCIATYAGVLGYIIWDLDGLTWNYLVLGDVPTGGYFCYLVSADTPGCAVWDHVVTTEDMCE